MFKLSHMQLNREIISVKRVNSKKLSDMKRQDISTETDKMDEAVKSALEVNAVKRVTNIMYNVTTWILLVIPTTTLIVVSMVVSEEDILMETDFDECFPEPDFVRFFSPVNGLLIATLAIIGTCILRNSMDELGIRHEITRNVLLWGCTYIVVLVLRSLEMGYMQPILISIQQMALSYSMIILPCKHQNGFFFFLIPGGAKISAREFSMNDDSMSRYSQSPSGSSHYSMASSSGETSMYEQGLEAVLATEKGVKKFAEHCAREFSLENIRFWQAVNQYREMYEKETQEHMEETANHIYEEYVKPGSEMQVNLPMTMAKIILKKITNKEVTIELFDDGQREIFNLMSRDSYQRFLNATSQRKKARRASNFGVGGRRKSISASLGL